MKALPKIKDNNADFIKAEAVNTKKAVFLKELEDSMKEATLAKHGKIKLKSAEQLLHEL